LIPQIRAVSVISGKVFLRFLRSSVFQVLVSNPGNFGNSGDFGNPAELMAASLTILNSLSL